MLQIDPAFMPNILVGLALLLLAGWLLWLDPASRLNRAFALLLFFRGLAYAMGTLLDIVPMGRLWLGTFHWLPYIVIPVVPVTVYFLSVYPRPRGIVGKTRWGPWALLAGTVGLFVWYAVDHSAYTRLTRVDGSSVRDTGALLVFKGLRIPALAMAGLVLSRDYLHRPAGSQGYSTFLVAAGLTLTALFDGVTFTIDALQGIAASSLTAWMSAQLLTNFLHTLALPIGIGALVYMARAMRLERTDATLQEARRLLTVAAPLAVISGIYHGSIAEGTLEWEFLRGLWNLLVPATVTYALLRFSLFDADIRLKAGVRRGIVLSAFAATFFVVSEAAEALFAGDRGLLFGILAAAILAAGARPLQEAAYRAADRLMPDTVPLHMLSPRRREAMYRDQFMMVGSDQQVTPKERRMLAELAEALHLSAKQVQRLETSDDIRGSDKSPWTRPPARATTSAKRRVTVALATALLLGALSAFLEFLVPVPAFWVGLLSAGLITVLLGPIDHLAMRLAGDTRHADPAALALFTKELGAAMSDGEWSRRDRRYLGGLAAHLGIDPAMRRRLTRRSLTTHGLRAGWRAGRSVN